MRKRLSYANVTATLALVFAMSGGAMAANHYLINSTKQINPKVLKSLKGNAGKMGATGATGAAGATGKEGPQGKEGLAGKEGPQGKEGLAGKEGSPGKNGEPGNEGKQGEPGPFPTTLPSGDTVTGAYSIVGGTNASGTGNDWGVSAISFPYPLASAPTVKVVLSGGPSQTGCSGTVGDPTAASGTLCVYEGGHSGIESGFPDVCPPSGCGFASAASMTGGVVRVFATSSSVRWYDWGSWAVTG